MNPHPKPTDTEQLRQLIDTVATLRVRCAWTQALTHESLRGYLLEESYEVLEAIDAGAPEALREELGDLLYQVLLHAQIGAEHGYFTLGEVAQTLRDKLVRRNRHVFESDGTERATVIEDVEEIIRLWDAAKAEEKAEQGKTKPVDGAHGLPAGLPALALAQKLRERRERSETLLPEAHHGAALEVSQVDDERGLGDALLALTARAQQLGLDAESVLRARLAEVYGP
ncbi:MazG nucleotide pyrophosphohydrolase domain-containing protein [Glutamicibacter sp. X7]